jgi:hypothetical protein
MSKTLADKIIEFNINLKYEGSLPDGFYVINPFLDNPETLKVMKEFYYKFYNDTNKGNSLSVSILEGMAQV